MNRRVVVTVAGPGARADLLLPTDVRISDVLPRLVERCGGDHDAAAEWHLGATGGPTFRPDATLDEFDVRDGATLQLWSVRALTAAQSAPTLRPTTRLGVSPGLFPYVIGGGVALGGILFVVSAGDSLGRAVLEAAIAVATAVAISWWLGILSTAADRYHAGFLPQVAPPSGLPLVRIPPPEPDPMESPARRTQRQRANDLVQDLLDGLAALMEDRAPPLRTVAAPVAAKLRDRVQASLMPGERSVARLSEIEVRLQWAEGEAWPTMARVSFLDSSWRQDGRGDRHILPPGRVAITAWFDPNMTSIIEIGIEPRTWPAR